MTSELAENVKNHRRRTGMSQEQLAEAADLSVGVIRKLEQGTGGVRVDNLHAVARALGTTTSALFATGSPDPVHEEGANQSRLVELRRALMPPVGLADVLVVKAGQPGTLSAIERKIDDAHALYQSDRYDSVAKMLPGILRSAEAAVSEADDGEPRQQATIVRSRALLMTGKYLTQVRQYDMAYHALSLGIQDARETGQTLLAAMGVVGMSWLLLRQDRSEECRQLAYTTAQTIEPRMSSASPGHLAVWGELSLRIASAAVRNNEEDESDAAEARKMAAAAANALAMEHLDFKTHWSTFGPVTAEIKKVEDLSLAGDARGVLRRADDDLLSPKSLRSVGTPSRNNWDRHRLDVAKAHVKLGSHQDAMDELNGMLQTSPTWLKHQRMARHVMQDILRARKRTLTKDMRIMAAHLGIVG
ncbi:helix-turn-helix transcriptional regulator [Streptomyces sp. NPDC005970]|uniref:helix-turn-helix domain-containing protein n=1 Tax=Streptomyces sp. NPDC005970 TaxID=3156723 RepID=UPI0033CA444F